MCGSIFSCCFFFESFYFSRGWLDEACVWQQSKQAKKNVVLIKFKFLLLQNNLIYV